MAAPNESVPVLVPLALNVEPAAPVSVPAVTPHVPVTALRFTPFVPPLEVTLANVPLTAPVARLSAVTPSVPNVAPLIAVVEPVKVTVCAFAPRVMVEVPSVFNDRPVVPPLIVPLLMVTLPLPSDVSDTPVVAPVVLTLLKVAPDAPTVTPLMLMPVPAAPVVTFAVPVTLSVPPPVALKAVPVPVVMLSVPLKLIVVPVFVVSVTPGFVVVVSVCVPVKAMVPEALLLTRMPVPLSVIAAPMVMRPAEAGRFWIDTERLAALAVMLLVASSVMIAVPLLTSRPTPFAPLNVVLVTVTVPVMLVRCRPELVLVWIVSVSPVKPACVLPAMPSRVAVVIVRPLTVSPSARVTTSLVAVVFVICGFVPAAFSVTVLTTSATPSPISCWLFFSVMPSDCPVVRPSPL